MCGLAGFVGRPDRQVLAEMMHALEHRGPDAASSYIHEASGVHLGHQRLSILDLEGGAQPMWNETHTVVVIFNGEIYNHADLRRELVDLGHVFATHHSDTEVLVHGYEEWGEGLALRLNGMFGFAIYDMARRRLFLARDRFGEKPLYYASTPSFFGFASELRSLACHPAVDRTLDHRALQKYFGYGYIPAPNALLKGARKLPAGHWLSCELDTLRIKLNCYWQFEITVDQSLTDADEPRLVDELEHLLRQAAMRRVISDVPLGVFLSGGVDSSTVLASLAPQGDASNISTFTIGFREPSFDESKYARSVARAFGSRHHEEILDIDAARELIPEVLGQLDEPLGDASILPTQLLCRFAGKSVKVALSGDGGDELFAGYDPFAALQTARLYDRVVPRLAHRGMRSLADLFPRSTANMSLDFKIRRALQGLSYPPCVWLPVWMAPLEPKDIADLFDEPLELEELYEEAIAIYDAGRGKSDCDLAMEFFTRLYLADDILVKSDRAAMQSSLEVRAVFLDNDLVDFARRLPSHFKYRRGERKYLLKKVARRVLPKDIVDRRKKGFGVPIAEWLRKLPVQHRPAPISQVDASVVNSAWKEHRSGKRDHRLFLWSWLSLQHTLCEGSEGAASYRGG